MGASSVLRVADWATASRRAAGKGDHRPARDWLLHAGVIQPIAEQAPVTVQVAVGVALPGIPAPGAESAQGPLQAATGLSLPALDLEPVRAESLAERAETVSPASDLTEPVSDPALPSLPVHTDKL